MGYSSVSGREAEHDLVMGNIVQQDVGMDNMAERNSEHDIVMDKTGIWLKENTECNLILNETKS